MKSQGPWLVIGKRIVDENLASYIGHIVNPYKNPVFKQPPATPNNHL